MAKQDSEMIRRYQHLGSKVKNPNSEIAVDCLMVGIELNSSVTSRNASRLAIYTCNSDAVIPYTLISWITLSGWLSLTVPYAFLQV